MTTGTFPTDVAAVDTMMGTRAGPNAKLNYANLTGIRDADSKSMNFPAQYMFKDVRSRTRHGTATVNYRTHPRELTCASRSWTATTCRWP